jgi:Tfp pilus assembly protein PilW
MKKLQKGFTIVELVLYGALVTILLSIVSQLFVSTLDVQESSESYSAVQQDGRYILSRISYDVKRATAITAPSTLGSPASSLTLTINAVPYTCSLTAGNLLCGGVQLNSYGSTVSALSFTRYGNVGGKNSIQMSFTLTSVVRRNSGPESRSFSTTVGLR